MITRLDQLTLAQFIDVACGEFSVLGNRKDSVAVARSLVEEYRRLTDPSGFRADIIEKEDSARLKAYAFMFGLLEVCLMTEGSEKEVRDILVNDFGRARCNKMGRDALRDYVTKEKRTAEFKLRHMGEDEEEPSVNAAAEDIRRGFDSEIAFVMAYFKMGIDVHVISASVYANLVRQAREGAKRMSQK